MADLQRENIALFPSRQHEGMIIGAKLDWDYAELMFDDSCRKLIRLNQWYTISKLFKPALGSSISFHLVTTSCSN
jgi:hypothetical protein